ncbi:MAG: YncE family protein [Emticicia sp.]|uniref:YncE family protein n=1 Tax=Emticicia sp. TaxID=1930953 RepID=UPI003BA7B11A
MKKILLSILTLATTLAHSQKLSFDARGIIAISDADMAASAFVDGKLFKERGNKDYMSIVKLPIEKYSDEIRSLVVSNSAINSAKSIVISPNRPVAYVVEARGTTPETTTEIRNLNSELPAGGFISVVDISDLSQPKVLYKFPTGKNPTAIEISPNGEYLALCSEEYGKELQVLELDPTGKPIRIINKPQDFQSGKISDVTWHPNNNFLAFTMEESKEVGLMKVTRDGPTTKIIRLDVVGRTIKVGSLPSAGQFTPDGKYYLIPDVKSNITNKSESSSDAMGDMFILKFNLEGTSEHYLITKTKLGETPTSFAISPDGSLVAVTNAKKSYYPWENNDSSKKASISLLKLSADGSLNNVAEYEFDGILPKNIVFDKSGENIAVTVFDYYNFGKHFGGIEFWKVKNGEKPSLQKQDFKLFMPRGCHGIQIVK